MLHRSWQISCRTTTITPDMYKDDFSFYRQENSLHRMTYLVNRRVECELAVIVILHHNGGTRTKNMNTRELISVSQSTVVNSSHAKCTTISDRSGMFWQKIKLN